MKRVLWVVLFLCAWPVFVAVWWLKPETRPGWVQRIVDFAHQYPKQCAWAGVVVGLIGGIGNITASVGATLFGLAVAAGCGYLLVRWWLQERAAVHAEIAGRADEQNQAYLAGDDFGLYGTKDVPRLD